MKLNDYIKILQEILEKEGNVDVKYQTLSHIFDAEKPLIKKPEDTIRMHHIDICVDRKIIIINS